MTLKVLEYDEAPDGGFTTWIEDSELRGSRSWVAHHRIEDRWTLTTMEGDDASNWLSQEQINECIALAKVKEEAAGWHIQYQPKPAMPKALKWNWRSDGSSEPRTKVMVDHYLTRADLIDLLCISSVPTGEELGFHRIMATIRNSLRSAPAWEPIEGWWENRTDDRGRRAAWAERLIEKL